MVPFGLGGVLVEVLNDFTLRPTLSSVAVAHSTPELESGSWPLTPFIFCMQKNVGGMCF